MPQPPPAARAAAKTAAAATTRAAPRTTPPRPPHFQPSPSPSSPAEVLTAAQKAETKQKYRRIIWTVAFASVIITGTIYGAGLKTQREWKAEKKKVQEATVDEKVAMLEQHKTDLMRQKREIEFKLGELRARMASTPAIGAEAGEGDGAGKGKV